MWKKGGQGEILCNNCTARSAPPGPAAFATTSAAAQHSNGGGGGGGGGKQVSAGLRAGRLRRRSRRVYLPLRSVPSPPPQSKQEIHRRSARLRNTKYKSAPAAEKKVSTKGKGRRHIFKLKNVRRCRGCPLGRGGRALRDAARGWRPGLDVRL